MSATSPPPQMATPAALIVVSTVLSLLAAATSISPPPSSFSLQAWNISNSAASVFAFHGAAEASAAEIKLPAASGLYFSKPLRFFGTKPGFSTNFTFSISGSGAPHGLSFWLSPTDAGGNSSTSILTFNFVAAATGDRIEIDAAAMGVSIRSANLSGIDMGFGSGGKLQSWIDYDGESERLEVRLTGYGAPRPSDSVVSYPMDLSSLLWREAMFVGMSSWSDDSSSSSSSAAAAAASSVYAWSFAISHGAPYRLHSEPLDPQSLLSKSINGHRIYSKRVYPWRLLVALVFGAACGFLVLYAGLLLRSAMFDGRPVAPVEFPENATDSGFEKVVLVGGKGVADKAQSVAA